MSDILFFAGFIFTVVKILLTRLPNPNTARSQFILLFFAAFFYLLIFLTGYFAIDVIYYCGYISSLSRRTKTVDALVALVILLVGYTLPLLFLLWDLNLLTTISGLMWSLFAIAVFLFIYMPYQKWRRDVH
ncbi:hypothetical protein KEJ47_07160 [Candidatus Bathyarchaeota archaeon]|nr:hypothetical protein [Candidatus Bathyarchaeota archaeon]